MGRAQSSHDSYKKFQYIGRNDKALVGRKSSRI